MKLAHIVCLSLCLALVAPCASAQGQQTPQSTGSLVQELMAKSNEVHNLRKSKNVSGIKSLLTDDFQYVGGDGRLYQRDALLEEMQEGALRNFQFYEPRAIQIDSSTALLTYNAILDLREGDEPGMAPRYQKVSDLWVRQGNDWRLKFEQATPVRPID